MLYDGVLAAAPAYAGYTLVNSRSLHCALAFTRMVRMVDAEVRSAIPGQGYRTRLAGAILSTLAVPAFLAAGPLAAKTLSANEVAAIGREMAARRGVDPTARPHGGR